MFIYRRWNKYPQFLRYSFAIWVFVVGRLDIDKTTAEQVRNLNDRRTSDVVRSEPLGSSMQRYENLFNLSRVEVSDEIGRLRIYTRRRVGITNICNEFGPFRARALRVRQLGGY